MTPTPPLLEAVDVVKHFRVAGGTRRQPASLRAVDGVSLRVDTGETLGLVGESGCGKSTLGRCLVRLTDLTSGSVTVGGRDISTMTPAQLRPHRRDMQMVFQDPFSSLNPRRRVGASIGLTLRGGEGLSRQAAAERVRELLNLVGLRPEHADRFPHEFSGGQRQRIGIARALAARPRLVVADEPVSSLDVSVQAQIINLFADLQESLALTTVFIAHDLAVVRQVCDRVAVMYLGAIVETGPTEALVRHPLHPYTRALLAAVPVPTVISPRPARLPLAGDVPSAINPPSGCRFHPRCPLAQDRCRVESPVLRQLGAEQRTVACHYPLGQG